MESVSLFASTEAVIRLAHAVPRSLEQVIGVRPESFSALQTEIADLELILHEINVFHTKTPNLAQAASLSVRLGNLNSTLTVLKELLAGSQNWVQGKDNGTNTSRSTGVSKEDEVRRMMFRIREERMALTLALSASITYV